MLKILQPGTEPLGQFDLEDASLPLMVGGEVGVFKTLDPATEMYSSTRTGPFVTVSLDAATDGELHGLVDDGTSGYGTSFGTVIGGTAGQGTGFGAMSSTGTVVVGPSTATGSGKVTLWTKPGLYGVTEDAFVSPAEAGAAATNLNAALHGASALAATAANVGKLTSDGTDAGAQVALSLGLATDSSLVSTTDSAVGGSGSLEYIAIYLLGVQK